MTTTDPNAPPPGLSEDESAAAPPVPPATPSPPAEPAAAKPAPAPEPQVQERSFLVVADSSPEMPLALRYAARRAWKTGGHVALLHVIEPTVGHELAGLDRLMRQEAREEAEALVGRLAAQVESLSGRRPTLFIREGVRRDELAKLLDEQKGISILVLAAGTTGDGPGPLISWLLAHPERLRLPLAIVPGTMTPEQLDEIT